MKKRRKRPLSTRTTEVLSLVHEERAASVERIVRLPARTLFAVSAAGVILVPLAVSPAGSDAFRLPKVLLFRADILVLFLAIVIWGLWSSRPWLAIRQTWRTQKSWYLLAALSGAWIVVTTLTSSNRTVSADAAITVLGAILFFVVVVGTSGSLSVHYAAIALIPALLNSVFVLAQRLNLYPVVVENVTPHSRSIALFGNPDYAGTFFVLPALCALTLALSASRGRVFYWMASAVLCASLVATQTLTAAAALLIGALALLWMHSRKVGVIAVAATPVLGAVVVLRTGLLRERIEQFIAAAMAGNYNIMISERLTGFLAAWKMFADRPLLGVGPGCFGWSYYSAKLAVEASHPILIESRLRGFNLGEAHNDHLQFLAETGAIGYLLFAAAIVLLARCSWLVSSAESDPKRRFVRRFAFPMALAVTTLMLAQFPFQLVGPMVVILFTASLTASWSRA